MQLIYQDKQQKTIQGKEIITFPSFSSYHLIAITARAKSEKQLGSQGTDDEDLIVKIDNKTFPKFNSDRLKDSQAAFSGGGLHNLAKTVYFLTFLRGKGHEIILEADKPPGTATFENLQVYTLNLGSELALEPKLTAEDGDRRPWVTLALNDLPLQSITSTITYSRRKRDSDDVKIKINGKTRGGLLTNIKHFLWRFVGSLLPLLSPTKTETEKFIVKLPSGLHYIELDADRMPTLENIVFNFGKELPVPEGIPTFDNPKWAGDFYDDPPEILLARLIFGEARGQSKEEKLAVAWVVKNRFLSQISDFGFNYHEVILKNDGVRYQFSPMNPSEPDNFPVLIDPLKIDNSLTKAAWSDSYEAATAIISGKISDPTEGAVFFHSQDLSKEEFLKAVPRAVYIKEIGNFFFYKLR